LIERSAKLQKQIYIELLKIIKPLEKADSFPDDMLEDTQGGQEPKLMKERKADMRHILGFLN
jgi:hypothetical protein